MSRVPGTTGKRKATEGPPPVRAYDAKLRRVVGALDNLARVGASFASGTSARFPLPAIAFQRNDEQEEEQEEDLLLPLRRDDVQKIKVRAASPAEKTWHVDGDMLEIRNPQWPAFLDECVDTVRETLGIAPAAVIEPTLHKMLLVEAGARLEWSQQGSGNEKRRSGNKNRRSGTFGTLLVVLPGAFEGGEFVVPPRTHTEGEDEATDPGEAITWRPSARQNKYNLSYAAVYDCCTYETKPVTSGTAVCLVYDLVTTTPGDVPQYGGPSAVQQAVNETLTDYFDIVPQPLAKRLKINDDAWRTINEFGAERHFVYIIDQPGDEHQIAQSLAAFCAQSRGQYVLYHSGVLCSRFSNAHKISNESTFDDDKSQEMSVTLKAPWTKYGESNAFEFPPVYLRHIHDVAPIGRAEEFPLHLELYSMSSVDCEIVEKLHRDLRKTGIFSTHALVVQPASVEVSQIARLPMKIVIEKLRGMLPEEHANAVQYAHRVLYHRPEWTVSWNNKHDFDEFVELLVEMNDIKLFNEFLQTVDLHTVDKDEMLLLGIHHFGWYTCVDSLVIRILSTPTWRGRINLILSVLRRSADSGRLSPLLDALLSRDPWTAAVVAPHRHYYNFESRPSSDDFNRLTALVQRLCPEKMIDFVSVRSADTMHRFIVPALAHLMGRPDPDPDPEAGRALRPVLIAARDVLKRMLVEMRNAAYTRIQLEFHCRKCSELQAFLSSTATEITIKYTGAAQRQHILDVMESATEYTTAFVTAEVASSTTVRLRKKIRSYADVEDGIYRLMALIA